MPRMLENPISLVASVERARASVMEAASSLTDAQGAYQPDGEWSVAEVVQHLYLAEVSGVSKIWTACENFRSGRRWTDPLPNRGKSIEEVVEATWKPKETAPDEATPHFGGPLSYWLCALASLRGVLAELATRLEGQDLEQVVFPHFLSGPLDARQRLEFLRFHMERHQAQIERVMSGATRSRS